METTEEILSLVKTHNKFAEWQLPDSALRACWNITRDHRARLVWSNRDFFRILQIYLQYTYLLSNILKFLICIYTGNPRVPPRVLASGSKPCGGKHQLIMSFKLFSFFITVIPTCLSFMFRSFWFDFVHRLSSTALLSLSELFKTSLV